VSASIAHAESLRPLLSSYSTVGTTGPERELVQHNHTSHQNIGLGIAPGTGGTIALVGAAFVLAAALLVAAIPHGMGVTPDSTQYLSVSSNLLAGDGLRVHWWNEGSEPLTHFPPGFPFVLAGLMRAALAPETAAFIVNLFALAVTTALAFALTRRVAGGSMAAGIAAAFAVPLARDVLSVHAMIWSEAVFIALGLAALLAIIRSIETDAWPALIVAAVLAGLASTTRYVGLALIGACALSLLVIGVAPLGRRCLRAVAFLLIACLPIGLLLLRNVQAGTSATNRDIAFHPPVPGQLRIGARALYSWFIPVSGPDWLEALLVLAVAVTATVFILSIIRAPRQAASFEGRTRQARAVLLVYSAGYVVFLLLSITFADAQTTPNSRLLSPILPVVLILLIGELVTRMASVETRRPAVSTSLALGVSAAVSQAVWITEARRDGLGYNSLAWQRSGLVVAVTSLPPSAIIYTNAPGAIAYRAGREVLGIPRHANPNSMLPQSDFPARMRTVCARASSQTVVYAFFNEASDEWFLPSIAEVRRYWHSRPSLVFPEGVLDTVPQTCGVLADKPGTADTLPPQGSSSPVSPAKHCPAQMLSCREGHD